MYVSQVFLKNVIQCICHIVAAMILLQTVWVAELNFQVSLFNELIAEITVASSCL